MAKWRKIETAPKDGTEFLVWSGGTGKWPRLAAWCENKYDNTRWLGLDQAQLGVPTHWMPLPEPPQS